MVIFLCFPSKNEGEEETCLRCVVLKTILSRSLLALASVLGCLYLPLPDVYVQESVIVDSESVKVCKCTGSSLSATS